MNRHEKGTPVIIQKQSRGGAARPHDAPVLAAVVLAAGASSRMGEPKALLKYRGKTFIGAILDKIYDAAIDHAIVAVSPTGTKIIDNIDLTRTSVVYNRADKVAGPIESIRPAVSFCVNHMVEYLLVWPVDQPHIMPNTVSTLINIAIAQHSAIAVPRFRGRRGHPVLFSRATFPELLSPLADQGARCVVLRVPDRVTEIEVDDRAVLEDIDTPDDYRELLRSSC